MPNPKKIKITNISVKNNSTKNAEVKFKINTQEESVTYDFRRDKPRGSERVDSYVPPTRGSHKSQHLKLRGYRRTLLAFFLQID
ncbi:hypothetical protein TNCV_891311 [Trichonephila clavipes]|nr:hypothetical protein TNCV_891311 [Trichonephila clavipes]